MCSTTIEATSKEWKICQAIGVVAICLSVPCCLAGELSRAWPIVGVPLFVVGLWCWIGGRAAAWYHHG